MLVKSQKVENSSEAKTGGEPMNKKLFRMITIGIVTVTFGAAGIAQAGVAPPPLSPAAVQAYSLLNDGGFDWCTPTDLLTPNASGEGPSFKTWDPNTQGKWLDRARWHCAAQYGGSDGQWARLHANNGGGNTDLLMQGVETYNLCTHNVGVQVCLDYISDVDTNSQPNGGLLSFSYPGGCWRYAAGPGGGLDGCNDSSTSYEGNFQGWYYQDGSQLASIHPGWDTWGKWRRGVCFSAPVSSYPDFLAFGWTAGQPFNGGYTPDEAVNHVGIDNVGLALAGSGYVHVDVDPDTLNPKSKGKWITAYITPAETYCGYPDPESFKIVSLQYLYDYQPQGEILETAIDADKCEYDDGVWTCKFPRSAVIYQTEEECEGDQKDYLQIGVAYQADGAVFVGQDHIRYLKDQLDTYCHPD
jgi:hypothetical protein